jgi:hypothetical protein
MTDTLAPASDRVVTASDNRPPDPLGAHTAHIADLYTEAGNWLDGAEIENADQADAVERLIADFKDAIDAAKASEVAETKPLQDQVKAIQQSYWPLIGKTEAVTGKAIRAKTMLLALKSKWARKLEAEAAARAETLRREAAEQARKAAEAAREAQGDLQATEDAETLIRAAQTTLRAATQAEKPAVRGMRDNWVITGLCDVKNEDGTTTKGGTALLRYFHQRRPDQLLEALMDLARAEVRAGVHVIPGLIITNERRAV